MESRKLFSVATIIQLCVIALILLVGNWLYKSSFKSEQLSKESSEKPVGVTQQDNILYGMTPESTTTATTLPVLVLPRDTRRNYAIVINDSDTAVYLTCKNFDSPSAASTTANLNGIRLNASGGSMEFLPENLCLSDIWASSTVSNKKIIFASSTLSN